MCSTNWSDNDMEISQRSFNKLSTNLIKNAYANGKILGEEQQHQKLFDDGFSDGFKIAYTLGTYRRGELYYNQGSNKLREEGDKIELCFFCLHPHINDVEYRQKQLAHINNIEKSLC